jgi:hypothetical protein
MVIIRNNELNPHPWTEFSKYTTKIPEWTPGRKPIKRRLSIGFGDACTSRGKKNVVAPNLSLEGGSISLTATGDER